MHGTFVTLNVLLQLGACTHVKLVIPDVITGNTMVVTNTKSQEVVVPSWLNKPLPVRCTPLRDAARESLVDLSLPVSSNPFHTAMMNTQENARMMEGLIERTDWIWHKEHILLIGSSGMSANCNLLCFLS